jgi:hypothetical protein
MRTAVIVVGLMLSTNLASAQTNSRAYDLPPFSAHAIIRQFPFLNRSHFLSQARL